jgi:hypothetical protein
VCLHDRHDAVVGESQRFGRFARIAPFGALSGVDLDQAVGRSNPYRAGAIVGERIHRVVADERATIMAERPAVGAPVTRAAGSCADPQDAAAILIQRHHVVVSQAVRVVGIAAITHERLRRMIEEVEPVRGGDPQPLRIVLHDRAHAIVAERARVVGVVAKGGHLARLRIEAAQAAVECSNPQCAGVVFDNGTHSRVVECPRLRNVVGEVVGGWLVASQTSVGADP